MTPTTPPAVSEAMREAVALASIASESGVNLAIYMQRVKCSGWQKELRRADAILSGPIASKIARLTGERDAAREAVALCNNSFGSYSYHLNPHPAEQIEKIKAQARSEWARAEAAEAELTKVASVVRSAAMGEWTDNYEAMVEEACAFEDRMNAAEAETARLRAALKELQGMFHEDSNAHRAISAVLANTPTKPEETRT